MRRITKYHEYLHTNLHAYVAMVRSFENNYWFNHYSLQDRLASLPSLTTLPPYCTTSTTMAYETK